MIRGLSGDALNRIIKDQKEKAFLIIDVRRPEEYRLDHIPGSVHIPLAEIQMDPFVFDENRKLIFYCRHGSRSKVAALFASEAGYKEENLYHLEGGMLEYSGEILMDIPRVELFPANIRFQEIMGRSIDLERGAFLFYSLAQEKFKGSGLYPIMEAMAQAEISHARFIYKQMRTNQDTEQDFHLLFNACDGKIIEGGKSLEEIKIFLETGTNTCVDILDFAIELEFSAYDLYKTMAENSEQQRLKEMFFFLAQAEKKHLDKIVQALDLCDEPS